VPAGSSDDGEIRSLLARLALLADQGEVADYLALFTQDAVWVVPAIAQTGVTASERAGVDAIGAGVRERREAGVQGPGTDTAHVVTTTAIRFTGDDEAVAESRWLFLADTTGAPRVQSIGRYTDTLRRTAAGWRLARREILVG
jgi:3-phenylpropionate/cinnamic acid dioxygenase small subunit